MAGTHQKIYKANPFSCPRRQAEMRIISFIDDFLIVRKILVHLGLWKDKQSRFPPDKVEPFMDLTYEPIDDGWSQSENISFNSRIYVFKFIIGITSLKIHKVYLGFNKLNLMIS